MNTFRKNVLNSFAWLSVVAISRTGCSSTTSTRIHSIYLCKQLTIVMEPLLRRCIRKLELCRAHTLPTTYLCVCFLEDRNTLSPHKCTLYIVNPRTLKPSSHVVQVAKYLGVVSRCAHNANSKRQHFKAFVECI